MTLSVIQERLNSYQSQTKQEEIGALKEIYQEIALAGLARSEFFKKAAFQGGTALRIVHQLQRFSEDLDFVLLEANPQFKWESYLQAIELEFKSFGVQLQLKDRGAAKGAVKTAFLKEDSFSRLLELSYDRLPSDEQKITIKLEVDTHPPEGSAYQTHYLVYPYPFSLLCQDLPSLFASKCHALLCRKYEKGRDWFDFLWYISRGIPVNAALLQNALQQSGPFKDQKILFDRHWLCQQLTHKIESLNWQLAQKDILNFLKPDDRRFTAHWNAELFLQQINRIHLND